MEGSERESSFSLYRYRDGQLGPQEQDRVAREEPLEVRVEGRTVAITMRSPGHDEELAAGFLLSEGIVTTRDELFEVSTCPGQSGEGNAVDVLLAGERVVDFDRLTRHVFTSSSCGVCGKTTLESVLRELPPVAPGFRVDPELLLQLPGRLRQHQETFGRTGGLHASGLFTADGELLVAREDVGRHNALDKVIGFGLLGGLLPLSAHLLVVSGRVSFELMQKALAAGIPAVVAISAPSSLAVELACSSGQLLAGFVRDGSMNVYAGDDRLRRNASS
jgi:FdhD protein